MDDKFVAKIICQYKDNQSPYDDQVKEDEMGGARSTDGGEEEFI
jgi:hypothetical protein